MFKIIKEQNNNSATILTQAITSDQFQKNQDARNTVIRANDLFYALSEAPVDCDVLVNVENNGVTKLRAQLGNGYAEITVENATNKINNPLITNVELTNENIQKLENILQVLNNF